MSNIYSSPEHYGLSVVGEIDWRDEAYSFDLTVVWWTGTEFAWADDSGCSCPMPFEDTNLSNVARGDVYQLAAHLDAQLNGEGDPHYYGDWYIDQKNRAAGQVVDLLARAQQMQAAAS